MNPAFVWLYHLNCHHNYARINLSLPDPISAPFLHSQFRCFIEGIVTLTYCGGSVVVIHHRAAFRQVELRGVVMAASHRIAHEIMHHLAVGSDAGGQYVTKSVHQIHKLRVCGYF